MHHQLRIAAYLLHLLRNFYPTKIMASEESSGSTTEREEPREEPGSSRRAIPEGVVECIRAVVSELLDQQQLRARDASGGGGFTFYHCINEKVESSFFYQNLLICRLSSNL